MYNLKRTTDVTQWLSWPNSSIYSHSSMSGQDSSQHSKLPSLILLEFNAYPYLLTIGIIYSLTTKVFIHTFNAKLWQSPLESLVYNSLMLPCHIDATHNSYDFTYSASSQRGNLDIINFPNTISPPLQDITSDPKT